MKSNFYRVYEFRNHPKAPVDQDKQNVGSRRELG